jgi:hypothetical protein
MQIDNVEIAPVDIAFIAQRSKNKVLAKKFMIFLSSKYAQEVFNKGSHFLPANRLSEVAEKGVFQIIKTSLDNVRQQTLFFDREAEDIFAQKNMSIWRDFIENSDVEIAINEMEKARLALLARSCKQGCENKELIEPLILNK